MTECATLRARAGAMVERNSLAILKAENARLIALLEAKGIHPIFLSYPVPTAVSPRFGLGEQATIRPTM